jgi:hypothetical protein
MLGKKETDAEKAAKDLANKLADETPPDEQVDLYPPSTDLNAFGEIPASTGAGGSFIDRKDQTKKA